MNIVIVGLGLIGGSIAKALTQYTDHRVYAFNRTRQVLDDALDSGAIHGIADRHTLAAADVIYLCLYPEADIRFVEEYGDSFRPGCIVTDACGIKNAICPSLVALSKKFNFVFVGGHPMAGKERSGFYVSEAALFRGASYILVPCEADEASVETVRSLAMEMGFGGTVCTTMENHDQMIAFTSQLPHLLACAYVLSPRCREHRGFSAGSYRDVSRVARINADMWTELFFDNQEALIRETDTLMDHLQQLRNALAKNDRDTVHSLLEQGRRIKEELGE